MRSLVITGVILSFLVRISAQELGIRAGVDFYKFHRIEGNQWEESDKSKVSPDFGISFRMPFKERSAFRTGLYYSDVSNKTDAGDYGLSHRFLKIPLQYGLTVVNEEIRSGFFLGPNLGYGLQGEYLAQGVTYNVYEEQSFLHKRFLLGLGGGVRAEYLGISLELQYNFDLLIPDGGFGPENTFLIGNEILSIWLGYSYSFARKPHRYAGRR